MLLSLLLLVFVFIIWWSLLSKTDVYDTNSIDERFVMVWLFGVVFLHSDAKDELMPAKARTESRLCNNGVVAMETVFCFCVIIKNSV